MSAQILRTRVAVVTVQRLILCSDFGFLLGWDSTKHKTIKFARRPEERKVVSHTVLAFGRPGGIMYANGRPQTEISVQQAQRYHNGTTSASASMNEVFT